MSVQIQIRRDSAANWTSTNPILAQGEEGWEIDTNRLKFGDGLTAWNSLSYFQAPLVPISVSVISTPYNASQTSGEIILLVDAATAGGNVTVNLPTAISNTVIFSIKKIDSGSNTVIIDGNGTQTIDGDLTKTILFQNTSITIISDSSNWWRID